MLQNDPLPEPILIVSDGEEGNHVEEITIHTESSRKQEPSVEQSAEEPKSSVHSDSDRHISRYRKGA